MNWKAWGMAFKNVLLPIFCRECGCSLVNEENGYFCPDCWAKPERIERPFCGVCGRPHREGVGFGPLLRDFPCADCRRGRAAPYRRVWGACDYAGSIAEAIKALKFEGKWRLAGPLAGELRSYAEREMDADAYTAIVPVPLHRVRRRARGFNQSELIARQVAGVFPQARVDTSLSRVRPTKTQSTLTSPAQRRENVRGAFAVDRERSFAGERVLLLDDVVTSGGTAAECARALKRAGAAEVDVLAVAIPAGRSELEPAEAAGVMAAVQ